VPGVELKLVPSGDKLEARLKGPNVTPGYWRQPDLTRTAFDEVFAEFERLEAMMSVWRSRRERVVAVPADASGPTPSSGAAAIPKS